MFNKNFYPTPDEAIKILTKDIRVTHSKILEPSAGKGNIVDYLAKRETWNSDKVNIDVLEIEPELQQILYSKKCNVVGEDFLKYETHTEYDYIVMNPPFDEGAKHLIKAIELAENQSTIDCDIRCILNAETISNPFSQERKHLINLIEKHNGSYEIYENLFKYAEVSTNVTTVIINIKVKSTSNSYKTAFDEIISQMEKESPKEHALSTFLESNDIKKREKNIYLYVSLYEEHVKHVKNVYSGFNSLSMYEKDSESLISNSEDKDYFRFYLGMDKNLPYLHETIERLRVRYWELILNSDEFATKLTNDARRKLMDMLEKSSTTEITIDNVKLLLQSLYQNKGEMLKQATLNMFHELTKNHMGEFAKNIHYYNGWKTNEAFKVGKKIIVRDSKWGGGHEGYNDWKGVWDNHYTSNNYTDLIKALTPLTRKSLSDPLVHLGEGKYENDTFIIKCYKKGTTHITFKDLDLLDRFNIFCGQQMNMLPTDYEVNNDHEAKEFMFNIFKSYSPIMIGGSL